MAWFDWLLLCLTQKTEEFTKLVFALTLLVISVKRLAHICLGPLQDKGSKPKKRRGKHPKKESKVPSPKL
jgi:hypothetical protein